MTKALKVKLVFFEDILGTSPSNSDIFDQYIASKSENKDYSFSRKTNDEIIDEVTGKRAEEVVDHEGSASEEDEEQKVTIFPKDDNGNPFVYDYMIQGFFKETCGTLRRISDTRSAKVKNYKKYIDGLFFVFPRKISFENSTIDDVTHNQRSLRAQTPQGERVALAKSEDVPGGSELNFKVRCFVDSDIELVEEWLDNGVYRGLGQWRNSGKGRFVAYYEEIPWDENGYRKYTDKRAGELKQALILKHRMDEE